MGKLSEMTADERAKIIKQILPERGMRVKEMTKKFIANIKIADSFADLEKLCIMHYEL